MREAFATLLHVRKELLFLAALAVPACSHHEDESGLALGVRLASIAPLPVENDLGHRVTIDSGFLTIGWVEIAECTGATALVPPRAPAWHRIFLGTAFAHSSSGAKRLGEPHVHRLGAADPLPLGNLSPPPGRYCLARIALSPADQDAEGIPAGQASEVVGKSLKLVGSVVTGTGSTPQAFSVSSDQQVVAEVKLPPFALDGVTRSQGLLTIAIEPTHWWDGISPAVPADNDSMARLLTNIKQSITATIE